MYVKIVFAIPVNRSYCYSVPESIQKNITLGQRARVNFNHRMTYGYIVEINKKPDEGFNVDDIKPVQSIMDEISLFTKATLNLAFWISDYYYATAGEVLKLMAPTADKEKKFEFDHVEKDEKGVELTDEQERVYQELKKLEPPDYSLIYGITGSGKTEIYFSLITHYLKKKSRLYI